MLFKVVGAERLLELVGSVDPGVDFRPTVRLLSTWMTSPLPEVSCWRNLDGTTPLLPMLDVVVLVEDFPMLDGVVVVGGMDFRPMPRPTP